MEDIGSFLAALTNNGKHSVNEKGSDTHCRDINEIAYPYAGMLHNLRKYRLCSDFVRTDIEHIDISIGVKENIEQCGSSYADK